MREPHDTIPVKKVLNINVKLGSQDNDFQVDQNYRI